MLCPGPPVIKAPERGSPTSPAERRGRRWEVRRGEGCASSAGDSGLHSGCLLDQRDLQGSSHSTGTLSAATNGHPARPPILGPVPAPLWPACSDQEAWRKQSPPPSSSSSRTPTSRAGEGRSPQVRLEEPQLQQPRSQGTTRPPASEAADLPVKGRGGYKEALLPISPWRDRSRHRCTP